MQFCPQPDLYQLNGDDYEGINIQPISENAFDISFLQKEPMGIAGTVGLKIGGHAALEKEGIIPGIRKEDQQYLRQVSFEYMGSAEFGEKFLDETLKDFEQELPMGYTAANRSFGAWQPDGRYQYELIALSLLFIFVISAVMFESLQQPIALLAVTGFSFTGLFAAFYVSDAGFDQGGYASFLFVTGVVPLPLIMVINEYNLQMKTNKYLALESYVQAIRFKIKPIGYFLTSALTSLVPFLSQGTAQPFWFAFAVGSLGGMIASVVAILFILPVFLLPSQKSLQIF